MERRCPRLCECVSGGVEWGWVLKVVKHADWAAAGMHGAPIKAHNKVEVRDEWTAQWEGAQSSRVICAAWRICPSSAFQFFQLLTLSSVLYSDTHYHQESRSRIKKRKCGRNEERQSDTVRKDGNKWMSGRACMWSRTDSPMSLDQAACICYPLI